MKEIWKIFGIYLLIIILMLSCGGAFGQVTLKSFNAGWNSANEVAWVQSLSDCKTISYVDVGSNKEAQANIK